MGKLTFYFLTTILVLLIINNLSMAQLCYLNSYSFDGDEYSNVVYEVDLLNKRIADSVVFDARGEFIGKYPVEITFGNRSFLISTFNSGLIGKNSQPGRYPVSHFNLIEIHTFDPIFQDSITHGQINKIRQIDNDSLEIEWFGDNQTGQNNFMSKFVFRSNGNRLERIANVPLSQTNTIHIGNYEDPIWLTHSQNRDYYWDIVDGTDIVLFKADDNGTISNETLIGDRTIANWAVGYNSYSDKLICVKTPFKLLSYSPVYESPNNVEAAVLYFNKDNFTIENTFTIDMGNAYCGYDVGKALSSGPFTYYFFFSGDGYRRFDPAYLLIFDTRTNEATWLRVGWR